jgi:hypothetical protein
MVDYGNLFSNYPSYNEKYVVFQVVEAVMMTCAAFCDVTPNSRRISSTFRRDVLSRRVSQASRVTAVCFAFITAVKMEAVNSS